MLQKLHWACLPGALRQTLSPVYHSTASSWLNHVIAGIYRFTKMRQSPHSRDTEMHNLIYCLFSVWRGGIGSLHTHKLTQTHACAHAQPKGGKSSPQQRDHPSAAGFFQLEHLAGSAVIYGNWFLTWGFFCYDRDPPTGRGRAAVRAGKGKEKKRQGGRGTPGEWRGQKDKKVQRHFRDVWVIIKRARRKAEKGGEGELQGRERCSETESALGRQTPDDKFSKYQKGPVLSESSPWAQGRAALCHWDKETRRKSRVRVLLTWSDRSVRWSWGTKLFCSRRGALNKLPSSCTRTLLTCCPWMAWQGLAPPRIW